MYVKPLSPEIINILCCPLCKGLLEKIDQKFFCKNCLTEYPLCTFKQGKSEERVFDFRLHRPDYCLSNGWLKWSDVQEGYEKRHFEDSRRDNLNGYLNNIDSVKEIYTKEFNIKGKVLDVGGHQGRLRHFLRTDDVSLYMSVDPFIDVFQGLDSQPNLLKAFPRLSESCNFLSCYAENLPFVENTFDWVHMKSVLDHFQDPYLALKEAYRVLKQEGILLIGSTVYGGKSFFKTKDCDNILRYLISQSIIKLRVDGIKAFTATAIKKIIKKKGYLNPHYFHWKYKDLIDLFQTTKFIIIKECWLKPPFNMFVFIGAKKACKQSQSLYLGNKEAGDCYNAGKPLVSILITTYNGAKYIRKAVDSALAQTYKNTEIVIIDDGSTDETPRIISELGKRDSRIVVLTNKSNLDSPKTLDRGIGKARGKYIAKLDDDDIWCDSRKLEKQVEFLERHPDYVLVGGGIIKINEENKEIGRYLFPEKDRDIRKSILAENLFTHSTVLYRKDAWEKAGGYDEEFGFFADWSLWLKMGKSGKFHNFQEYFTYYLDKEQNNNYTKRNFDIRRKLMLNIRLRKKYRDYYPGYKKSFLLCLANYFYSFLPFRKKLHPFCLKLRKIIFGSLVFKENEKF